MGIWLNFLRNSAVWIFFFEHLAAFKLFPDRLILYTSAISAAAAMPQVSSLGKML